MTRSTKPHGSWRSLITSEVVVTESARLSDILLDGGDIYWNRTRPHEGGRSVLVRHSPDGRQEDVNPPPLSVRTRVHEYGGGAATVDRGTVYYSNFSDQRLYCQMSGAAPVPLTPAPQEPATPDRSLRYADGIIDQRRRCWIGVREDHTGESELPINTIVDIDLAAGGPGRVLVGGNDFYSSPKLSPDGTRLAWLTWHLPHMPWVGTELFVADIADDGTLGDARLVAGSETESVFQPEWSHDGVLYFVSDRSGWWNLYRLEGGAARPLCPKAAEFGQPQWNFGLSSYAFVDAARLVCSYSEEGRQYLAQLDLASLTLTPIELPYTEFGYLRARGEQVVFRGGSPAHAAAIVLLDLTSGVSKVLHHSAPIATAPELRRYFSPPKHVEFPTADGESAHALHYAPFNPDFTAPPGEKPPLLVRCHGGPTSATSSTLDLRIQYWTSRGIAVLDVDYRGSTGYGRAYRDRLHGHWGVADVDDCIDGARFLITEGQVDPDRVVITGGSAGGYTTLCALAFRDFFKAGASHYGVSDAAALARDTHKFERRYLDWLIGPYPEQERLYRDRSPVWHAANVKAPVIFFQGDQDKVVPPNQTELMVNALRSNRIPVAYLLFSGEQHGFRHGANIKRAVDAELYFFATLAFRADLTF